jgi:hypothetical protein
VFPAKVHDIEFEPCAFKASNRFDRFYIFSFLRYLRFLLLNLLCFPSGLGLLAEVAAGEGGFAGLLKFAEPQSE